jgi:two-component system, sensor histidine kinase
MLVEVNEQLVIAALHAHIVAERTALDLRARSHAAQEQERADAQARETLARTNAELEQRVLQRTTALTLARDDALAAVNTKERFLANMSHEIRTPMAGMLGALELLSHTALAPDQAEYLQIATTSGAALMAIINEVLDFAKIGSGQLERAQEPIDVGAIAHSVVTLFSAAAQIRTIGLSLHIAPELELGRIGDSLHLRQVLMNLVGNAMKFTSKGSVGVWLDPAEQGDSVHFEVADTGIGIDPAQQAMIFEPFMQSEPAGRLAAGGAGLGLAISRDLVRVMGGELRVDSAPGRGSRFHFELKLPLADRAAALPMPAPPPTLLRGQVLLVEDNPVNQLIGRAMLERLGLSVVVAEDGVQALDRLAETVFEAILMDCQMPVLDGYETTRRWRTQEQALSLARTPVIAITANVFDGDVERCMEAGMDSHLAKPYTGDSLRAALAPWLPGSTSAVPAA